MFFLESDRPGTCRAGPQFEIPGGDGLVFFLCESGLGRFLAVEQQKGICRSVQGGGNSDPRARDGRDTSVRKGDCSVRQAGVFRVIIADSDALDFRLFDDVDGVVTAEGAAALDPVTEALCNRREADAESRFLIVAGRRSAHPFAGLDSVWILLEEFGASDARVGDGQFNLDGFPGGGIDVAWRHIQGKALDVADFHHRYEHPDEEAGRMAGPDGKQQQQNECAGRSRYHVGPG